MSRRRLPARRRTQDRHDVPPGPAGAQRAVAAPSTASHSRPRRSSRPPSSTSGGARPARPGLGRLARHVEGEWDALVKRVRRARGTVVVSHEILAPAPARAQSSASLSRPARSGEVHVVYSARDLPGRSPPRGRRASSRTASGLRRFLRPGVERGKTTWFWRAFRACPSAEPLERAGCRPSVHVVTVPQPARPARTCCGSATARRSASTRRGRPRESERANRSIGAAETQPASARLNRRMGGGLPAEAVPRLIRELVAQETLAAPETCGDAAAGRLRLGRGEAEEWIDWVRAQRHRRRRRPRRPAAGAAGPPTRGGATPTGRASAKLDAAVDAMAALTPGGRAASRPATRPAGRQVAHAASAAAGAR